MTEGGRDEEMARRLRSQADFVGSVTHALKGALNGLQGGLYLIESGIEKKDERRLHDGALMMEQNVQRAKSLVGNVLYYAKERVAAKEKLALHEGVERAVRACEAAASQRGVRLEQGACEGSLMADGSFIHSLLCNLIELALEQVSVENGRVGWVKCAASLQPPNAVFDVTHSGKPVEPGALAGSLGPVFKPFGADRAGLWVYAARRICEAHGGCISIEVLRDGEERFLAVLPAGRPGSNELDQPAPE